MENQTILSKLDHGVSVIIERYNFCKQENEALRVEMVKLRAESDAKSREIEKLFEDNALKDMEIEEIVQKIESLMV
jgi:cell division protein FtsB